MERLAAKGYLEVITPAADLQLPAEPGAEPDGAGRVSEPKRVRTKASAAAERMAGILEVISPSHIVLTIRPADRGSRG